ncbi:MAG TPA: tRNA 5-methoxyuridine(34)/uridine 5-oxyacetic acid(34) synthase CmoB [Calditrichia bacterium]|nr:tRNA 5-methoxyuridine(34)/uridine 5-oxyacetic acid(34) synthase CmoB [Calditrichia bacterium]
MDEGDRALLQSRLAQRWRDRPHGDWPRWRAALDQLPAISPTSVSVDEPAIRIGEAEDLSESERENLPGHLKAFCPWRKGPFRFFGVEVDCEWRSDLKWERLRPHLPPLENRRVLDVGCGNGYYGWRMMSHSPNSVVGIDPFLLYGAQYLVARKYMPHLPFYWLPLGFEDLEGLTANFEVIFSMGVLYHRRSPLDHLRDLWQSLTPAGSVVLETLVIDGPEGMTLLPPDRYAGMRNVWFLPSLLTLESWLKRSGFSEIRLVNTSFTDVREQRPTEWMSFHSLPDFLQPDDPRLTVEGLPAPQRAIFIATRP